MLSKYSEGLNVRWKCFKCIASNHFLEPLYFRVGGSEEGLMAVSRWFMYVQ